eukprot:scaffold25231_cov34-Prasinocladus_malaysianus.AAC.5
MRWHALAAVFISSQHPNLSLSCHPGWAEKYSCPYWRAVSSYSYEYGTVACGSSRPGACPLRAASHRLGKPVIVIYQLVL